MLVIVGTGLAGYSLAREVRKLDPQRPILMLTADDGAAYSKPMLSTGFAKGKTAEGLVTANAGRMAEQLNLQIRTFTRVTAIDRAAGCVCIGEERIAYEQLVLALGAEPRPLALEGDAVARVQSVNDLMDYRRLRDGLVPGQHVLILGAGLIGCEFANDFLQGGLQVTLVAPSATALPLLVPEAIGEAVEQGLASAGAVFRPGRVARRVDACGEQLRVTLDDGEAVLVDRVVSAVGLLPRVALAREAGLDTGQGIRVDAQCRSSDPAIYALGDCAEVAGRNLLYVQPLMICARSLARTLCGSPEPAVYPVMPVVVKTPACPVVVAPPFGAGAWEIEGTLPHVKAICRDEAGHLVGFAVSGDCCAEKQALTQALQARLSGIPD